MTHDNQTARSDMKVHLDGNGSSTQIISRSVAKGYSDQTFYPIAVGNAPCKAHIQCDSIIMDNAKIRSIPEIEANHRDANIIHEAAIGRINNDQLIKLQTFGLSEEEAEKIIIEGFLK
ncbi:FeS cluster assembly protein SufB [bioreactor metagenome]|uniref:FeS cluster assembly protein SufB n=1 Tax=bioreactor metagenome TaxID=1076179 RepID=A0A645H177_9ZZZZ